MKPRKFETQELEPPRMAFSVSELSRSTGISDRKLWQELHQGRLAHVRIGRRVVVTKDQLDEYLRLYTVNTFDPRAKASEILKGATTR